VSAEDSLPRRGWDEEYTAKDRSPSQRSRSEHSQGHRHSATADPRFLTFEPAAQMKFDVSTQLCEFQSRPVRAITAILEIEFIDNHGTDCRLVLAEKEKHLAACTDLQNLARPRQSPPAMINKGKPEPDSTRTASK
jgi:hypothetical protein